MKYPDLPDAGSSRADPFDEKRETTRFALLMRSAKLIGSRGECLCIVRDVSETGVKLRLFHPLAGEEHMALELMTGERLAVDLIWEHNGEAGFRFLKPIDVMGFIAETGPYPRRPIRLKVNHPAMLTVAGKPIPARLCDLSREGARIETEFKLAIRQNLRIKAEELPEFEATVCWRRQPAHGLVFHQVMSLEELANRAFRMQPGHMHPER